MDFETLHCALQKREEVTINYLRPLWLSPLAGTPGCGHGSTFSCRCRANLRCSFSPRLQRYVQNLRANRLLAFPNPFGTLCPLASLALISRRYASAKQLSIEWVGVEFRHASLVNWYNSDNLETTAAVGAIPFIAAETISRTMQIDRFFSSASTHHG